MGMGCDMPHVDCVANVPWDGRAWFAAVIVVVAVVVLIGEFRRKN